MKVRVEIKSFLLMCLVASLAIGGVSYPSAQSKPNAPREALLTAMRAQLNAKSYRAKEVQTGTGEDVGIGYITMGNYVAPDKYHASVERSLGSSGRSEVILLGGVAYSKKAGGEWQEKQVEPQRMELEFARLRHAGLIDNLSGARNVDVKLAGQEELDGSMMLIYQYSFSPPETVMKLHNRVWVGVGDGLPHKIEVKWGTTQKGLKFAFKTTTTFFDYNADIVIRAPM